MFLILEITFMIMQLALIALSVHALRIISKKSMYSYKIVSLIGGIIFFSVCFLTHLLRIVTWPSDIQFELYHLLGYIIGSFTSFASIVTFLILPPFCIFLIISNVTLLKKEGRSLPNFLGILLCFVLIVGSAAVLFSYDVLDQFMNVHSYAGYCFSLWIENLFAITVSYFECVFFATMFVSSKARRHIPSFNKDHLIILGCHVRDDGRPGGLLRGRIDRAIEFAKLQKKATNKELTLVPSGGQGVDEPIAEAASMKNYLLEKHIPKSKIIVEDKSKTTAENFRFSKKLLRTTENVAFATSSYHVFRAGVLATNTGFKNIEGVGSKSPWYYHDTALIREFVANLSSEKRMHIRNIVVIVVSVSAFIAAGYFLNVL